VTSARAARLVVLVSLTAGACAALVSRASAQDAVTADEAERHTDHARTLFGEGVALVAERRFEEAEARFREALALHDAPSIRANLASVLYEQGELAEAVSLAESVTADAAAPEETRASATTLVEQIRAQAGYVRIDDVEPGTGTVAIDAHEVADPTRETPVSPGAHVATLTADGVERARAPFEIATGEHRALSLAVLPTPEEAPSPPQSEAITDSPWLWVGIAGGVVIVAVAVGVGVGVGTTGSAVEAPVSGDFQPGVLRW
jgi:hypothetical protein